MRQTIRELEPADGLVPAPHVYVNSSDVDEQISRSLLEARALGFAFQRLAGKSRPDFAWRCAKLGDAILEAVRSTFPETER